MDAAELLRALDEEHARGREALIAAATLEDLDAAQVRVLGRKSTFGQLQRGLGTLPDADRRDVGAKVNAIRADLVATLDARRDELGSAAESARLAADRIDITLPGRRPRPGSVAPFALARPPTAAGIVAPFDPRRTRDRRGFHLARVPRGRRPRDRG